jgi:hypothetical protein
MVITKIVNSFQHSAQNNAFPAVISTCIHTFEKSALNGTARNKDDVRYSCLNFWVSFFKSEITIRLDIIGRRKKSAVNT